MTVRDTTRQYEPIPGYYVDEAPYGYWGYGVSGIDGMILGGWMNLGRDKSLNSTFRFSLDLTSQLNLNNEIKAGIDVAYNDYDINSYTENPSMSTWNRSQKYNRFPYRLGVYAQDKLEFKGFIANVGLRLDYSDPNGMTYVLDVYDPLYREALGLGLETEAEQTPAEATLYVSPRLGVSHPITENSKLYFNYGHFTQEPSSTYRFRLQREYNGLVTSIGNPNLIFERTIAYELGYEQSLLDQYLLAIAAYYKDVTDQPGWVYYENINRSVQYNMTANNNYEDIRGLELTLTKRIGAWVAGFANYTYEVSTSGYFGLQRYYEDPNKQRDYLRANPYQDRPHPRPFARVNLDLHTPNAFGPVWLGHHYLGDWNLNILSKWKSGAYETYNPRSIAGLEDNVQWKDSYNIDLRLTKSVKISRYEFQFYMDLTNVLNTKLLSYAGFSDYYDYLDYLGSLHFSWETDAEHGSDRIGEYRESDVAYEAYNPTDPTKSKADLQRILDTKAYIDMPNLEYFQFLNPRDLKLGVKVSF
jgi:outer membrane receptor protein involved in Fe transport